MKRDTRILAAVLAFISTSILGASALCTWAIAHGASMRWRLLFRVMCHGIPGRCFYLAGVPMPICARCTAIYAGLLAGIGIFWPAAARRHVPTERNALRLLAAALIPMAVDGLTQLARLREQEPVPAEAVGQLATQRLLLIWDNFEAVHSMPDPAGATPPLDAAGRDELARFLQQIAAGGRSTVIVTSRTEETWLPGRLRRIMVGGLAPDEAIEYADQVLEPYPAAAPRRAQRAFAELMEWLDGHPLSMRLMLPHVETTDPQVLLAGLRGIIPLPAGDDGGRTTSLAASVTYSFTHLTPETQRLLVAVSLFQCVADVSALDAFSRVPGVPQRFRGRTTADWSAVLDHAASVGLLSPPRAGMYGIHPALPAFLAQQWRLEESDAYHQQRAAADAALRVAYAALGEWLARQIRTGDATFAFAVIDLQRRTLGNLLGHALDRGQWDCAHAIAQPLNAYWDTRGLHEEARGWVDRARLALETAGGTPPPVDDPAGALWQFFIGSQDNRELAAHHLNASDLDMLQAQGESLQQLATGYHKNGRVAQWEGHLDDAEHWYHKGLTINKEIGNQPAMAIDYHQLGQLARLRHIPEDAEHWHHQALTIIKELGNRPAMAYTYHELGALAAQRRLHEEAGRWYSQAIAIYEEIGDRPRMADAYHDLGTSIERCGRLDDAENWYHQSLIINEEIGNRRLEIANTYHQLGLLAFERGRPNDAEDWYRQAITISRDFGYRNGQDMSLA